MTGAVDTSTARRSGVEIVVVVALVVFSALLHLWDLGRRPLAHDEAIDAWFSWQARGWDVMRYDPVYHGPLRFYLEGPILRWVGTGAAEARLLAAICGIAATALIAMQRRLLGRHGAPLAALLFTISPTILTVTRTGREDSLTGLLSLGLLLLVAAALVAPRPAQLIGLGALLAASFAVKETTFLFGLAALLFFLGGLVVAWRHPHGAARQAVARLLAVDRTAWVWTVVAFAVVFMVVFTSGFRYAAGLQSGLLDGLRYWWSQHDVGRGSQRWFFHLTIYVAYEWLLVAVAAVGAAVAIGRRSLPGLWFLWMAVAQVALYSWAGEKFAWLALHPLLPTVLLAGLGAEAIVRRLGAASAVPRALAGLAAVTLLVATTLVAIRPAVTHGADPRELLVTVQTSDDVPPIAAEIRAAAADGRVGSILVDANDGGSWPWVWYLHGVPGVSYVDLQPGAELPAADVVIAMVHGDELPPGVDPATVRRIRLRQWWLPDYGAMGVGDYLRWFFTREVWNPTGSTDQFVVWTGASSDSNSTLVTQG